jgi:osmotically-inducible protein OsmY
MNQEYQYLVGKLQEALARDARVNALDIKITIAHGRVHLTGQLPTEERREAVQRVTREIVPDLEVRNDITVLVLAEAGKPEAVGD